MINSETMWITSDVFPEMLSVDDDKTDRAVYFRRNFNVTKDIAEAQLFICPLGLGVCTINAKAVTDDVLTTPFTRYDKRVIYMKYDVTNLINSGENAIGVHVGNGFYNNNMTTWNDRMASWRDKPKLAAVLRISYTDGTVSVIQTDELWKTDMSPCIYNHMRQGEKYDARLVQTGFDTPGFDDSGWKYAVRAYAPGGRYEENFAPAIKIAGVLEPVEIKNNIYDFGVNISGWVNICVNAEPGREIRIIYDEALDENGDLLAGAVHKYAKLENKPLCHEDVYICGGMKDEQYHPNFCYHGFRYVKICNAPSDIKVVAHFVHTDFEEIGSFECSDTVVNTIHEMTVRSIKSNFVGIPTDCPQREQNGWTADALIITDATLMNFDAYDSYRKWLRDFGDAQRDNGHLPGIIPSAGWGYNGNFGPSWDCAVVLIPYKAYLHSGKTDIISDMWDTMTKYMTFLENMSSDYIVGYGYGDWCPPVFDDRVPNSVTDTAIYYEASDAMAKMAEIMGNDSQKWSRLAQNVRNAWRSNFVDFKNKSVSDKYNKYQTFFACALYYKFYDNEDERRFLADSLVSLIQENDFHIDCGILGTEYIFCALSDNGHIDIAYKMLTNPTYPGYVHWINSGMTTLCETWGMTCSLNHQMFGSVDDWFYTRLGGIRYTYDGLEINPQYIGDIEHIKVCHRGIEVERRGTKVRVLLPCSAKIYKDESVTEVTAGEYYYDIQTEGNNG